jgi:hypothetical protein
MEISEFSKLPKKRLVMICEKLIDDEFEVNIHKSPYYFNFNIKILENISKYFSISVSDIDLEFIYKFMLVNDELLSEIFETKNMSLSENLIIPTPKEFLVDYESSGRCRFIEKYEETWSSYDEDWVIDSMNRAREDGNWDLYDGRNQDTDYEDYEVYDFEFGDVEEIRPKNKITESKIQKGKTPIDSMDKKTLLKLRGLIDYRLSKL